MTDDIVIFSQNAKDENFPQKAFSLKNLSADIFFVATSIAILEFCGIFSVLTIQSFFWGFL